MIVPGQGATSWHAARMLSWLGAEIECHADRTGAAQDWAASGAMALTGRRLGSPLPAPGDTASAVGGALLATRLLAPPRPSGRELPDARVLSERAAVAGFHRDAPSSVGGSFRMLRAADGWIGLNLARPSDVELVPAWLEATGSDWESDIRQRSASVLAERARMLGLPASALPRNADEQLVARGQDREVRPFVLTGHAGPVARVVRDCLVIDLSALWAGPLCAHLLTTLGARVIKVESLLRPDGARNGPERFYDLLHSDQEAVALDFGTTKGRAQLAALIDAADIVIESSRPRALRHLGIRAEEVLARAGDKCWISITAYGRTGPWSNAVGFGDDVAVAAGLLAFDLETGIPAPCGDAIADPITGVNAALVAVACRMAGGRWLADLAMREQVAAVLDGRPEPYPDLVVAAPQTRHPRSRAPDVGADTARILREFGVA
ncbi:hypothetical protein HGB45_09505 [Nocardia cerradoensis]|nr:hypothetical protein [Nocardia cerradoensis]